MDGILIKTLLTVLTKRLNTSGERCPQWRTPDDPLNLFDKISYNFTNFICLPGTNGAMIKADHQYRTYLKY